MVVRRLEKKWSFPETTDLSSSGEARPAEGNEGERKTISDPGRRAG
jgi:hypothetical protein